MSRKLARHSCADHMHSQRGWKVDDTIVCSCGRMFTLRPLTFRLAVMFWRGYDSQDSDQLVWVRDHAQERADSRERLLREREWRRG